MNRRTFLSAMPLSAAAAFGASTAQTALPRWRGFNLLDLFQALSRSPQAKAVTEDECRWIRDWGFNFLRVPLDYWFWTDSDWRSTKTLTPDDPFKIKESALEPIDRIVQLGQKYGLHINLNLHRAPGYCINNSEREPFVLWSDPRAEEAFALHWEMFAKRYSGVSEFALSFNLLNEAPAPKEGKMSREDYRRVMTRATEAIRAVTPKRPIIIDGFAAGSHVVDEMIATGVAQSVHAYTPAFISHYRASWVDKNMDFPEPAWPMLNPDGTVKFSRKNLEDLYAPWGELARNGIGVHCGECGCFNRTPHPVFLAWFTDVLDILSGYGIGYSLWQFQGTFGVLSSGRADVEYEDWYGHKLDRKLLSIMQKY